MRSVPRKPRRTPNACIPCRQSKIKCTGNDPCANCQRRLVECRFAAAGSRVVVSERYLRELQNQSKQWQRTLKTRPASTSVSGTDQEAESDAAPARSSVESSEAPQRDSPCSIWTSPFTLPSTIIKHSHVDKRNWIWLAPASPWSFTARLTVMMTDRLGSQRPASGLPEFHLDGDIYQLDWTDLGTPAPLSVTALPSFDYALHLFDVTKFHVGQVYRIFEEEAFKARIHALYHHRDPMTSSTSRVWFVQFLLVLAFGHAFLSPKKSRTPPGSRFFARAMSAMPMHQPMGKNSFMIIEALALASLYLYAIDYREQAHVNLGQAMRIAQLEGLHTQLPEEDLGAPTVARCQNLWWSLYILDRQVSFSLGLPMTTQENDITTLIKVSGCSLQDEIFSLQVRLSQMQSFIVSAIYKTEKTQLGRFLEITRDILHNMAGVAEEIERISPWSFRSSMDTVPQETRYVILLYHQCVIIATRPLLLSVLMERLEKLGREEEDWQKFLTLPKSLISIGIKSAQKTLQILSDENVFFEAFLPFDLEFTFAAALHLTMGNTIFPPETLDHPYLPVAHSILDEMIGSGNRVAEIRKNELRRLEGLFQELDSRVKKEGLRALTLLTPTGQGDPDIEVENNFQEDQTQMAHAIEPGAILQTPRSEGDLRPISSVEEQMQQDLDSLYSSVGISSYEFLSIADQIGNSDVSFGSLDPEAAWLDNYEMAGSY